MTEQEYRTLDIDSYSSIKMFIEDRKKYYKKFILREVVKEEETPSTIFGGLVDCLHFTPSEYDSRYTLSIAQVPTGQYGKFVEELMKVTVESINENGEVTRDLEDMMLDAYNNVKFDRNGNIVDFKRDNFEVVKRKFLGSDLEVHYRQLRESHGKTIIELSTLENAQSIVSELKTNIVTKDIMTMQNSSKFTVYDQFPIVGELDKSVTKTDPYPLKCLVDRLIIDHERKRIHIYDLKTCWDNEQEFLANYFKYKYYVQMAVYFYLVVEWKKKEPDIADYAVHYPAFIVAETNNYKNPLIYATNWSNFDQGMMGFQIRNRYHPGVVKAITDIMWHKETGIWNISKDNHKANGIVRVQPFQ